MCKYLRRNAVTVHFAQSVHLPHQLQLCHCPFGKTPVRSINPALRQPEPHLLFLKRPEGDYRHAGQIAFPGGKRDAGESALDCALREAQEEVGLASSDVEVFGALDEYDTVVTGFRISPFVGLMPYPYELRPAPREVERLLEVPLRALLDPAVFHCEQREAFGRLLAVHYYSVGTDLIWGVTGGILTPLLEMVRGLPAAARQG